MFEGAETSVAVRARILNRHVELMGALFQVTPVGPVMAVVLEPTVPRSAKAPLLMLTWIVQYVSSVELSFQLMATDAVVAVGLKVTAEQPEGAVGATA